MNKKCLCLLIATVLMGGVCMAQAQADKPKGMNCFYASHSLMWDMPPVLTELTKAYAIQGHTVLGIQRLGVSRTSQHWNLPDEQNQAKQALKKGNVDAFIMSPIGLPDPAIESFVKLGLEHNPATKFYVQISWPGMGLVDNDDMENMMGGGMMGGMMGGPRRGQGGPGAGGFPGPAPAAGGPEGGRGGFGGGMMGGMFGGAQDYNKTPEELAKINVKNNKHAEEQAKKINDEIGRTVVYLVPTAQAHNALRTMIYNKEIPGMTDQGEVFRDAIGHPTDPVIVLNAYLHFAVMYGVSPVGLPVPSILKNSSKPEWKEEKFNRILQDLAWKTVVNYAPSGISK